MLAWLGPAQDTAQSRAECYVEKGMLYQKQRDYRRACKELKEAVKLDPRNHQAWNVLGLCQVSQVRGRHAKGLTQPSCCSIFRWQHQFTGVMQHILPTEHG